MSTQSENSGYVLGKDVPWESITGKACRVKRFTAIARIDGGKVRDAVKRMPYALLRVESPVLADEAMLPVVHRVDFLTTWKVFEERGVGEEEEAIVVYMPSSGFLSSFKPRLHFYIYPKGHLEEIYDPNFKPDDAEAWMTPIAEWQKKAGRD